MRNKFTEYFSISKGTLKNIWDVGIFALDTNVLLNNYRYSPETVTDLTSFLKDNSDRTWIPHQVGVEFFKNRIPTIATEIGEHEKFLKDSDELLTKIKSSRAKPFLTKECHTEVEKSLLKAKEETQAHICRLEKCLNGHDSILSSLAELFDQKVGDALDDKKMAQIQKDGPKRYDQEIPPGYKDFKKKGERAFGDLILWFQVIEHSKNTKSPIIFISDDMKEDWWSSARGKKIGPRPELIREFFNESEQNFYMYDMSQFLKQSRNFLSTSIQDETINEINKITSKPSISPNQLIFQIDISGDKDDILSFYQHIKNNGYDAYFMHVDDRYSIVVELPDIPDLERRFEEKYLNQTSNYSFSKVKIQKKREF